jgi:hypothetical protein
MSFFDKLSLLVGSNVLSASNQIPVKLVRADVAASVTRPSDTTQYAINDVLSNSTSAPAVLNFADLGASNAQAINIVGAMATSTAKQSTLPGIDLWLFKNSGTAVNDNAAFAISDAENDDCVAVIPFPAASWKYSSNNSRCDVATINIPVILDSDDVDLYGIPVLTNTYTPVSAEVFKFTLKVERA